MTNNKFNPNETTAKPTETPTSQTAQTRRSMLKSIGAMGIFASTFATTAATRARATPTTQTDDPLNDFDPVWRSVKETTWYEEEFYNPMWEADYPEGGISIRRVLVLNDYAGQENRGSHLYEFGLFSIGVSAYAKDVDGRHISYEGIFPDGVWHSTHEITCESTDPDLFDVQERVNPTHPRVIAGISNDKITETPTTDGWIGDYTKKADLDNVSVNIRGPDVYLGTAGLGIGLMGSALSGGMTAVFAGTSYGLPAGSLIAGVSDNDTEFFEQRPDKLIYNFRDEGIGGVNDIGAFSHSVRFYISVKNHEGPRLKIGDKIEHNGNAGFGDGPIVNHASDAMDTVQANKRREWTIDIPRFRGDHDHRYDFPAPVSEDTTWYDPWTK